MPMRRTLFVAPLFALSACATHEVAGLSPAPPAPSLRGSVRVVAAANGQLAVEVAAHLYNPTTVHLHVPGPNCPIYVHAFGLTD